MGKLVPLEEYKSELKKTDLERSFETLWRQIGGPDYDMFYKFHPSRNWEFDFAFPDVKVAIELEGGVWSEGRHTRGGGFIGDCEKYNAAELLGWSVFRIATGMTDTHLDQILQIRNFIHAKKKGAELEKIAATT